MTKEIITVEISLDENSLVLHPCEDVERAQALLSDAEFVEFLRKLRRHVSDPNAMAAYPVDLFVTIGEDWHHVEEITARSKGLVSLEIMEDGRFYENY